MKGTFTTADIDAFAAAASAYLATLEHVESTLPGGVGQFTPDRLPAHHAAGERVVRLLERFAIDYDVRAILFRGYLFTLVPAYQKTLLYVIPQSVIATLHE